MKDKETMVYTHTKEYFSAIKSYENRVVCTIGNELEDILSELSQSQNNKCCIHNLAHMLNFTEE